MRALAVALALASCATRAAPRTVVYASGAKQPAGQSLDLYTPEHAEGAPVLVFFHGGVWRMGDKADYADVGRAFARRGIITAIANYRLFPDATHAEQLQDVAHAIAWVWAHAAELGGNPARLFLAGHSAGAELIASLVLEPALLRQDGVEVAQLGGVIPLAGIFDLRAPVDDSPGGGVGDYLVPIFGADLGQRSAASPQTHLRRTGLRWLVLAAGRDSRAMQRQSERFAHALQPLGDDVRSETIPEREHFELITALARAGDPAAARIEAFVSGSPPAGGGRGGSAPPPPPARRP
jgi:acetyl esterase/lipase